MRSTYLPVIISGGTGSRLWPVSREAHPKPFLKLPDGQSLLQKTFLRAQSLPHISSILTVTHRELYFKTQDEYKKIHKETVGLSYILEPISRNTAAAIVSAALFAKEDYLLILPSDHYIQNETAFQEAVHKALSLAEKNFLVTFGVTPHYPETGYGYIETSDTTDFIVTRFVEKPSLEKAKEYIQSGKHFWNSGMFCFRREAFLEEMKSCAPDILRDMENTVTQSTIKQNKEAFLVELEESCFSRVKDISIDYALMEKSKQVVTVPCDIGWEDIGTWNALSALTNPDHAGNVIEGKVFSHKINNCYIQGQDRIIAAVGVENLIIVDTEDAILIANRYCTQEVKHIVNQLKQSNHQTHKIHKTVHRPWGMYTVLEEGKHFKIKRVVVKPGASLSLHLHLHRSEHWVIIEGAGKVIHNENTLLLHPNESAFIPAGHHHKLENPGLMDLVLIEIQSGEYIGEDDLVRVEITEENH